MVKFRVAYLLALTVPISSVLGEYVVKQGASPSPTPITTPSPTPTPAWTKGTTLAPTPQEGLVYGSRCALLSKEGQVWGCVENKSCDENNRGRKESTPSKPLKCTVAEDASAPGPAPAPAQVRGGGVTESGELSPTPGSTKQGGNNPGKSYPGAPAVLPTTVPSGGSGVPAPGGQQEIQL
ncbi:hypothetical protein P43SY_010907 [Pythium insidiosum]|uniref:Carbohydrate-binding protein n=1 Tax=Pythium insidiosum TaxID=114742 RepID=A0AAD5LQ24_PYTIN|nr:hypothetical protein P43SY_010907 [Pythium insidiosum]